MRECMRQQAGSSPSLPLGRMESVIWGIEGTQRCRAQSFPSLRHLVHISWSQSISTSSETVEIFWGLFSNNGINDIKFFIKPQFTYNDTISILNNTMVERFDIVLNRENLYNKKSPEQLKKNHL